MTVPAQLEHATQRQIDATNSKVGFAEASSSSRNVITGVTTSSAMEAHAAAMTHNYGSVPRCVAR